jgi:disulfide bond formation protein DsbB
MSIPSSRITNITGLLICISAMLFAILYLENVLYLDPCPFCIMDRVLIVSMGVIFLLAALHNPGRTGQRVYGAINLLLIITAIGVAGRHIWLQYLPADKVPECGAGLEFMLETMPLNDVLAKVLKGSGSCADVQWTFMGLSIPEQTMLLFIGFLVLILIQLFRKTD